MTERSDGRREEQSAAGPEVTEGNDLLLPTFLLFDPSGL